MKSWPRRGPRTEACASEMSCREEEIRVLHSQSGSLSSLHPLRGIEILLFEVDGVNGLRQLGTAVAAARS